MGTQINQQLAEKMVAQAIATCAEEHFASDNLRMRHAILQGHCEYCKCLSDNLVLQVGEFLGQMDKTIKAIYQVGPVYPEEDRPGVETARFEVMRNLKRSTGINLIAWVERKSAAL